MRVGIFDTGINVGRSHFHLPTTRRTDVPAAHGKTGNTPAAQVVRGTLGLVILDQAALAKQLEKVVPLLEGTQFSYKVYPDRIDATCP